MFLVKARGRIWSEPFPAEQARIVQLPVERFGMIGDGLELRIRAEGLVSLMAGLRQRDEGRRHERGRRDYV